MQEQVLVALTSLCSMGTHDDLFECRANRNMPRPLTFLLANNKQVVL